MRSNSFRRIIASFTIAVCCIAIAPAARADAGWVSQKVWAEITQGDGKVFWAKVPIVSGDYDDPKTLIGGWRIKRRDSHDVQILWFNPTRQNNVTVDMPGGQIAQFELLSAKRGKRPLEIVQSTVYESLYVIEAAPHLCGAVTREVPLPSIRRIRLLFQPSTAMLRRVASRTDCDRFWSDRDPGGDGSSEYVFPRSSAPVAEMLGYYDMGAALCQRPDLYQAGFKIPPLPMRTSDTAEFLSSVVPLIEACAAKPRTAEWERGDVTAIDAAMQPFFARWQVQSCDHADVNDGDGFLGCRNLFEIK